MILRLLFVVFFSALAPVASAQELASLIADEISVDPSGKVTATGNVEVYYKGTRLTASSISYSRDNGRLTIEGPIRVYETDGTILVAEADLAPLGEVAALERAEHHPLAVQARRRASAEQRGGMPHAGHP